jgi:hypothetical protein
MTCRQYMLNSFPIHVAQCAELFEKREALKPPKERRAVPADPMMHAPMNMAMSHKELDAMNAAAQKTWSQEALMPCENCGRR